MEVIRERPWSTVWHDGTHWVKRGPAYEPALTAALSARWPDRVVEVVDVREGLLVLADAGSTGDAFPLEILPRYAELQRGEAAHADEHLAAGVPDQRVATMLPRFDEFPQFLHFRERFAAALERLTLPPTVQHDDLHAHNVFGGRIIDWGDTVIAHPFASLLIPLRVHEEQADAIRGAYLEAWPADVHDQLEPALQVAAFARILSWQRIAPDHPSVQANIEWFLEHVASS